MSNIVQTTEWECDTVRLVRLDGLARGAEFPYNLSRSAKYYEVKSRQILEVLVHHAAGPRKEGISQPKGLAGWIVRSPIYKKDADGNVLFRTTRSGRKKPRVAGGGRGWPGAPYHFQIPAIPEVVDGRIIVYRLWGDDWRIWHTGGGHNTNGIGVNLGGWFASRHAKSSLARDRPDELQMEGLERLVVDYLFPRYGLAIGPDTLLGHFDAGKVTCPGDFAEEWIRSMRGEHIIDLDPDPQDLDSRSLKTWQLRQEALVELGYDVGPAGVDGLWGYYTRSAVEAFQEDAGLVSDGIWGSRTEKAIRGALKALSIA